MQRHNQEVLNARVVGFGDGQRTETTNRANLEVFPPTG